MKTVQNDSLQGLEVYFNTEKGYVRKWLGPKEILVVRNNYITEQIMNLQRRRLVKVAEYNA